jgi:nucleoside 2-deoxyribosyltransferase
LTGKKGKGQVSGGGQKIYFAGPDVFRPGYQKQVDLIKRLCAEANLTPLIPGQDPGSPSSEEIFLANLALIDQADGLIANFEPFRGPLEPDSGTVFEVGYAYAKKKFLVGILPDDREMKTKVAEIGPGHHSGPGLCRWGWQIEDFGLPLNLMLAEATVSFVIDLPAAIREVIRLVDYWSPPGAKIGRRKLGIRKKG